MLRRSLPFLAGVSSKTCANMTVGQIASTGWLHTRPKIDLRPSPVRFLSVLAGPPSTRASSRTKINASEIIPLAEYDKVRKELAQKYRAPAKQLRRVLLGPSASFLFTNYDLIWFQIHEMLRIEKGGDAQIADEIDAYASLVPQGGEICGCLMFEVDNAVARKKFLEKMVGSEHEVVLSFGSEQVAGTPIHDDIDRTHPEGRTSAIHFLRWKLSSDQINKFKSGGPVILKMNNRQYPHMTELPSDLVASLAADL